MLRILAAVAMISLPSVAFAQATQQPAPSLSGFDQAGLAQNIQAVRHQNFLPTHVVAFQKDLTPASRFTLVAERIDRADRVAALIDAGQCSGAVQLASAEGDRAMVRQVQSVCRARRAS